MISFEHFAMEDGSPIYTQIIRYVKQGIVAGTIRSGDEMPSRRVLSSLLGVNPNTAQKAYRLLEEDGVIESRAGAKSCVAADEALIEHIRAQLLESSAQTMIGAMKQMGVSREEALSLVSKLW